jgi:hypothetical protein
LPAISYPIISFNVYLPLSKFSQAALIHAFLMLRCLFCVTQQPIPALLVAVYSLHFALTAVGYHHSLALTSTGFLLLKQSQLQTIMDLKFGYYVYLTDLVEREQPAASVGPPTR